MNDCRTGSQSLIEPGAASQPSQASTWSVGSSVILTATMGHGVGALHSPTWSGVARLAAREPPSIIKAPARTHKASTRRCQRGSTPRARRVYEAVVRTVRRAVTPPNPFIPRACRRGNGRKVRHRLADCRGSSLALRRPSRRPSLQLAADSSEEPQIQSPSALGPRGYANGRFLGDQSWAVRGEGKKDELEPKRAKQGCPKDVADSRDGARRQQRSPDLVP